MNPRRVLRIARWEASTAIGGLDRRAVIGLLVVGVVLGGLSPVIASSATTPGEGLYTVGITPDSPYREPVERASRLRVVMLSEGTQTRDLDLVIRGRTVMVPNTDTGRAAAAVLRDAIATYNDRIVADEPDRVAAYPVLVTLRYRSQETADTLRSRTTTAASRSGEGSTADRGGTTTPHEQTADPTATDGSGSTGGGATDERRTTASEEGATTTAVPVDPAKSRGGVPGRMQSGTPSAITPPFPLRSLLLAFVFVLPFNVIIQAYGGSILAERIDRRGEPLLVSPAARGEIVSGKTLPYLLVAVGTTAAIALAVGGGLASVAAMTPLAALFLAATFVAGMLVRSYKELTFVTVAISVGLTAYAFVPAVFTQVHPIAAISPLSVVVTDLQGAPITLGGFVLSTGPVALSAVVLFVLGAGMYREEDMFTRKRLSAKAIDAVANPLDSARSVGTWTALYLPFVFVAELFLVAVLFVLPTRVSVPVLLVALATVEEIAKSGHVFAGFERGRFDRTVRTGLVLGLASGAGFFLAEKVTAITQLVGLPGLEVGRAAFAPAIAAPLPLLVIAPLALHTATAAISARGAATSRRAYVLGLGVAIAVHVVYNYAVVGALA
ncbi:MAG: PrsW family intramembrane metalloprotease [Halanaeroarchaeum sp.]